MNLNHASEENKTSPLRAKTDVLVIHFLLWVLFLVAIGTQFWHWLRGDQVLTFAQLQFSGVNLPLGFKIDILSTSMFVMVTLLGATIGQYSLRYLNGERRQSYFYRFLFLTLTSVSFLVLASNLLVFFIMWLTTSFGLHKLLVYYPERKAAVDAARKKFFVSRLGDIALILGIGLTYHVFGTFDFSQLFEAANRLSENTPEASSLSWIGLLFVFGAMTKSAQFPFHFWLPETMEAPTPVSALMHAGVINAGGFLIIRLSPILQHADLAHFVLAAMGAITAVFGALVMVTQNNIKQKLAYSTISQMGIMMFSCGLGSFSLALFHIVAHSFYKAHAFLTTGLLVEESKKIKFSHTPPSAKFITLASLCSLLLVVLGVSLMDGSHVAYFTYAAVLLLGLAQNVSLSGRQFRRMGFLFFAGLTMVFSAAAALSGVIESIIFNRLGSIIPIVWGTDLGHAHQWITCLFTFLIFVFGFGLSGLLIQPQGRVLQRIYVYLWNGGYFLERTRWLSGRVSDSKNQ